MQEFCVLRQIHAFLLPAPEVDHLRLQNRQRGLNEQEVSVPAQLGRDEGVGSRTRGSFETVLGEQRVEERTSAVGIAR